jgi:hypothetical protein
VADEEMQGMLESEAWGRFLEESLLPSINQIKGKLLGEDVLSEPDRKGLVLALKYLKNVFRKPYEAQRMKLPHILTDL